MNLDPLTRHALEVSALRPDPLAAALPAMDAAMALVSPLHPLALSDCWRLMDAHWRTLTDCGICEREDFDAEAPALLEMIRDDCAEAERELPHWFASVRTVIHSRPCPCGSRELDEEGRCARCGAER